MRNFIYQVVVILLLIGCSSNEKEMESLLPNSIELKETLNKKLTVTSFNEYDLIGNISTVDFSNYPKDIWKGQGWKSRHWGGIETGGEKKDLLFFLQEEKSKYAYNGKNTEIVNKVDAIIKTIEVQSKDYLISYFYKERPGEIRKPPLSNETYTGWLFFFYLDLESQTITRISNAYR